MHARRLHRGLHHALFGPCVTSGILMGEAGRLISACRVLCLPLAQTIHAGAHSHPYGCPLMITFLIWGGSYCVIRGGISRVLAF